MLTKEKESMEKSQDNKLEMSGRNSINSRKSDGKPPNFNYPEIEQKKSNFGKDPGDSVTVSDLKRRIESQRSRESER